MIADNNIDDIEILKLTELLKKGTSPPMVAEEAAKQLKRAGFQELSYQYDWGLDYGGKYYMKHHATSLVAFTVGRTKEFRHSLRIAAAHTDFPCLRIKPNPDMNVSDYHQINIEVYGGPILNTWLDRPLSISGRVAVTSSQLMHPQMRLISVPYPLMVIPNLAIHMNREVNKGVELNKQTNLLPIFSMKAGEADLFMDFLAHELAVKKEDILEYELYLYCTEQPVSFGMEHEFILSPRLDNLTSVQALISSLINAERKEGINVIALFDHEEVGSKTKQGAGSLLLLNILEKINYCFGRTSQQVKENLYESMLLSVDVAHGLHPSYIQKMDLTNKPKLENGFCIKEAGNQTYATDCEIIAIVEQICRKEKIPYQKFVNRSDLVGGGTLGSIASSILPVRTVDIGVPILAMHSAAEMMGKKDQKALTDFITAFFQV